MITSISLENFKCFHNSGSIPFAQITLVTGSNGRGKSSLFQSMLLLAQSTVQDKNVEKLKFNGKYINLGTFCDVLRKGAEERTFSIELTSDDSTENHIKIECETDPSSPRKAKFSHFFLFDPSSDKDPDDLLEQVGDTNSTSLKDKGMSASSSVNILRQLSNTLYVSAERNGPTSYAAQRDNEETDFIGVHGEYAINTLYDKREIMESVKQDLSYVMGGASIDADVLNDDYIRFLIDSQDGQTGFKPVNVGFGYSYILPVIIAPYVAESGCKIFIENPEAHLHPGAQSRLMDVLIRIAKGKNLQLFIETHSDHIINALRIAVRHRKFDVEQSDASIIHITREEGVSEPHVWSIKINDKGDFNAYPKDLQEEWGLQMIQLL